MVQIDIQMPSDCYSCWVRKNMGCKIANDSGWLNNKRDDNCPLKEQEPVEPIPPTNESDLWKCGNCNHQLFRCTHQRYCEMCGREVKWK